MKYLSVRWQNTFKERTFFEGLMLLNKPAVKPTVTDDDGKGKETGKENGKDKK
jgi:hypothetical protein